MTLEISYKLCQDKGKNLKKVQIFPISKKINRHFSEDFKRSKVQKLLKNELSIQQLCDLYDISRTSASHWLYKYSPLEKGTKMVVEMESKAHKTKNLLEEVAELERIIGQKQLAIDVLEKTLKIASEEVGYDLKKKYGQNSSSGLGNENHK